MKNKHNKKKWEKSAIFCAVILLTGILFVALYYIAIFTDHECDSAVAVQSMITVIGAILAYNMYNYGLKNSRNKYGVDETGQPYCIPTEYDYDTNNDCKINYNAEEDVDIDDTISDIDAVG